MNAGAEGVGLLRTEFLFLNRSEPPSEEEQPMISTLEDIKAAKKIAEEVRLEVTPNTEVKRERARGKGDECSLTFSL